MCGGTWGVGLAAAPLPPHRAGLCSPPGTSSTPRRRPRSGATRTPSVGSPSRTTRRICPRPPPCPWHWWGRARSPASVSAPQPHPTYPLGPPLGTWALCWALAASGWMGFSSPPPVSGAFGPSKVLGCGWGTRGTHHLCFRASSPPLGLCPQCSSPLGVPREQSAALPCSSWLLHISGGFRDSRRGVGAGSR